MSNIQADELSQRLLIGSRKVPQAAQDEPLLNGGEHWFQHGGLEQPSPVGRINSASSAGTEIRLSSKPPCVVFREGRRSFRRAGGGLSLPRLRADAPEIPLSVDDREHGDVLAVRPVHQAVALHDQFTDILAAGFRHRPALARKLR